MLINQLLDMTTEEILAILKDEYAKKGLKIFGSLRNMTIEYKKEAIYSGNKSFKTINEWAKGL